MLCGHVPESGVISGTGRALLLLLAVALLVLPTWGMHLRNPQRCRDLGLCLGRYVLELLLGSANSPNKSGGV